MKNKMKGQQNIRRPLPIRIMALVMAVVMIFSVVYINNRKDVVKAESNAVYTAAAITNLVAGSDAKTAKLADLSVLDRFTVNTPYSGVTFGLESISTQDTTGALWLYDGKYYLTEDEAKTAGGTPESIEKIEGVTITRTYVWQNSEDTFSVDNTPTSVTSAITSNSVYLWCNSITCSKGETPYTIEMSRPLPTPTAKVSVGVDSDNTFEVSKTSKTITVNSSNAYDGTEGYFGTVSYGYERNDAETTPATEITNNITQVSTVAELETALNASGSAADGYYNVYQIMTVGEGENTVKTILASKQVSRDFYLDISDFQVYQGTNVGVESEGVITLSSAKPNQEATISFKLNESAKIKVTKATDSNPDLKGQDGNVFNPEDTDLFAPATYTLTLLGDKDEIGLGCGYTFVIEDLNGNSFSQIVSIEFDDDTPTIGSLTINGNAVTSSTAYVNAKPELGATITPAAGKDMSSIERVEVYSVDSENVETKVGTVTPSGNTVSYTPETVVAGNNNFKFRVISKYGAEVDSSKILFFYDNVAPTFTSFKITQGETGTEKTVTKPEDGPIASPITLDNKLTCKSQATIEMVGLDETDGSGLSKIVSVNGDGTETDVPIGGYIIEPDINNSGKSASYTFKVYDLAGNSETVVVNVVFCSEEITITGPQIVNSAGEAYSLLTDNYITWTGEAVADKTKRDYYLVYTVVVDKQAPLYSATLKYNSNVSEDIDLDDDEVSYTDDDTTGKRTYTISKKYSGSSSHLKSDIKLVLINDYGSPKTSEATVVRVDSTDPTFGAPAIKVPEDTVNNWYKAPLILSFASDDDDSTTGMSTGIKGVTAIKGATVSEVSAGAFTATVDQSTYDPDTGVITPTTVELALTDNAGNISYYNGETTENKNVFKVDGTPPTTGLVVKTDDKTATLNGSDTVYFKAEPSIYYKEGDTLSGVKSTETIATIQRGTEPAIDIDMGAQKDLSYYYSSYTDTDEFTVTVYVEDKVGNTQTDTVKFKVDTTGPDVKVEKKTTAAKSSYPDCYNKNVEFDVVVTDNNITVGGLKLTDTNSSPATVTWTPNADNTVWTGKVIASSEGPHNITITATDNSTLSNSWTSGTFTIDQTHPSVTTLMNGSEYTKDNSYNKSVTTGISYSDDNKDDNDITATIVRDIPGGGQTTSTKKGLGPHSISEDGKYTVTYKVVDKAGNSTTTDPIGFTVDNTAPVHNLYVTTANPSKVEDYPNNYINGVGKWQSSHEAYRYGQFYNGDVTVELNYFDYNLDWVYVTDNGEEISPSWTKNGAFGKATYTFTSEGYHDVQIWSKDLSGNETNDTVLGKRVRFTIDRSAPSITTYLNSSLYSEGSGTRYLNTNGSLNVSVSEGNKDTYDLTRSYKVTPPGGTSKTYEDKVDEGTENYSEEADYEVSYVAVDKAGNKSATRNVYFRVDRTAPKLTINGPGSSSNASSTSVSFNVQESFYWDMTSCTVKIYKKVDGSGEVLEKTLDMNPSSANYSQSYSFVDDAEYRMEFTAEDKCGNKSQTDYTFIKDGNAPSILLSGVKNYDKTDKNVELTITIEEAFYTSNRVTLSGTRTDIDGKSHKIDFDDFATNRTKISQLQQMFKEDGIYDITVTSTDKAGNSSSKTVHFTIDTTKPVIGDLSKYDGVKLNTFKWDVDLDELVKDLTVCDIKLYLDGALYDGTSDIEDGSHVLKVEATDELGHSSSKEVTFVLDSKAPNIIVMNVEEGDNLLESTDITVTVELDEDSLDTVTLNDKAINIANNEGKITVNEKGDYVLNATAHDEAGNVSSVEIKFSYGKQTNLLFIGIIAGAAILLLLLLLVFLRRRRENN